MSQYLSTIVTAGMREARLAYLRRARYYMLKARQEVEVTQRAGAWSLQWARVRPRMAGPIGRLP